MSLNFKIIGKRIKEVRLENGLTQEKLAELSDLSASYISKIESGSKKASLKSLVKLGNILGVSIDNFLSDNKNNDFLDYTSKLLSFIEDCNNLEKQLIFNLAITVKTSLRNT